MGYYCHSSSIATARRTAAAGNPRASSRRAIASRPWPAARSAEALDRSEFLLDGDGQLILHHGSGHRVAHAAPDQFRHQPAPSFGLSSGPGGQPGAGKPFVIEETGTGQRFDHRVRHGSVSSLLQLPPQLEDGVLAAGDQFLGALQGRGGVPDGLLSLRELEALARLRTAVLLALHHASVARKEAVGAQALVVAAVIGIQGARQAVAAGVRLPRRPAA